MVDTKVPTIIFCHDEIEDKGYIASQIKTHPPFEKNRTIHAPVRAIYQHLCRRIFPKGLPSGILHKMMSLCRFFRK